MNTVPYQTKNRFNCGLSAFFNLTGIKGSPELEDHVSKEGTLKPFKLRNRCSDLGFPGGDEMRRQMERDPSISGSIGAERMLSYLKGHGRSGLRSG